MRPPQPVNVDLEHRTSKNIVVPARNAAVGATMFFVY